MSLNGNDIVILQKFHEWYFDFLSIKKCEKPDIVRFCIVFEVPQSTRYLTMLSLYYFFFWRVKYAFTIPKAYEIREAFIGYTIPQ